MSDDTIVLRTPSEWEAHLGTEIRNRHHYYNAGHTELSLIDYDEWRRITETKTMYMRPKADTVKIVTGDMLATTDLSSRFVVDWAKESARMPIMVNNDTVPRSRLKERIETKIEEYSESRVLPYDPYLDGIMDGLTLALGILEEVR